MEPGSGNLSERLRESIDDDVDSPFDDRPPGRAADEVDDRYFSLAQLLAMTAVVAVLLSLLRMLPTAVATLVLGLLLFLGLMFNALQGGVPVLLQLGWWMLLASYLLMSAIMYWNVRM